MLLSLPLPQTHLLSKLPIPDSQVLTIDPALPVEDAAEDYARKLRQVGPRTGGKPVEDCGSSDWLGTQTVALRGQPWRGDLGWGLTSQGHSSADPRFMFTKMEYKPPGWISLVW